MIALILCLQPSLVLADEPTKGLDEQVGAVVRKNLLTIKQDLHLSMLIITHDIALAQEVCDDVLVMYLGRPVEHGPRALLFDDPRHPYTRTLLAAMPQLDPTQRRPWTPLPGEPPSPLAPPPGCAFHTRCPLATDVCRASRPELRTVAGRAVACHHAAAV